MLPDIYRSSTLILWRYASSFKNLSPIPQNPVLTLACQPLLNTTYLGPKISLPFQPKPGSTLHFWKRNGGPRHARHQRIHRVTGGPA